MRRGEQPPWIVSDGLWARVAPLLPRKRLGGPGRRRLPDRKVLCGILFVLHTGIAWEFLPQQLGFGSGMTCWRRLAELNEADRLDWSKAVIDSSHVRAMKGGPKLDRARSTAPGPARNTMSSPK